LKIHHTATMQMARNDSVMATLTPTLTSEISADRGAEHYEIQRG
jgi:hypothetical protein